MECGGEFYEAPLWRNSDVRAQRRRASPSFRLTRTKAVGKAAGHHRVAAEYRGTRHKPRRSRTKLHPPSDSHVLCACSPLCLQSGASRSLLPHSTCAPFIGAPAQKLTYPTSLLIQQRPLHFDLLGIKREPIDSTHHGLLGFRQEIGPSNEFEQHGFLLRRKA